MNALKPPRTSRGRLAAGALAGLLLAILSPTGSAEAYPSPFGGEGKRLRGLPFKWSAEPANKPADTRSAQAEPAKKASPQRQKQPQAAKAPRGDAGRGCVEDAQCGEGTYCDRGRCISVRRPINILYLFYKSGDRRFTELLGIYWHQKGRSGYRVVFPFYWHFWTDERRRSRVVFPFYWRFEDRAEQTLSVVVPPFQYRRTPRERNYRLWPLLFWTDYDERGAGLTVLPLFHYAREAERRSLILPLFLTGYSRDPAKGKSRGLVLGMYYWHTRDKDASGYQLSTHALFPLFYHSRSPGRSFTWALPLNFYSRRGDKSSLWIFPFAYRGRSGKRVTTVALVPPLYYHRRPHHSRFFMPPLFWYKRDQDKSFWLFANIYRTRWDGGSNFGVFPLYFQRRSRTGYTVLFPVLWHSYTPKSSFTLAGPVFHLRRGKNLDTGVLPLFYYRRAAEGRRASFISPLVLYERDDEAKVKQWGTLVPPYYQRRDADHAIDTLFPLVWRWHNRVLDTTTWVVPPAVFYSDPEGKTQVAFPFFWRFTDSRSGNATSVLFPLFYRHSNPKLGTSFNLLLPFYYRNKQRGFSAGALPLLFFGREADRRHFVLFPLAWHLADKKSATTIVGPFYHRSQRGRGWLAGLAPLLFFGDRDGESHQVLFPLLWHLRSRRWGYDTYVAGPFFHTRSRKGRLTGLVPLFVHGRWRGTDYTTVLPPLYYHRHDRATESRLTVVGPYYRFREKNRYGLGVLPLFHHRRTYRKDGQLAVSTTLLPLFHHAQAPGKRLLVTPVGGFRRDDARGIKQGVIGPFVWSRTKNARGFALLPLLFHWQRPAEKSKTTVLLPIGVRHVSPKLTAHVWFPIFWRLVEPKQRVTVLFPLFWRIRRPGGDNADVLFPLVWRLWNKKRSFNLFGPAFSHATAKKRTWGLFPLALYRRNQVRSDFSALPLIYYRNDFREQLRTWVFGPGYFRRYKKGYGFGLFPLLFHKRTPETRHTVLAPLIWHFANTKYDTSTTFVGPMFYRRKVAHKAVGIAPVFYAGWDRAESTAALFPLFYHHREMGKRQLFSPIFGYEQSTDRKLWYAATAFHYRTPKSSMGALLPLFAYHRNHHEQRSSLYVFPVYFGRWSKARSFHLAFPLVWRFRRVDSSSTVVFPFYWDVNDFKHTRTTVVFPLMFRHRNHTRQTTAYLFPPGFWLKLRRDSTDAVLFPLVWHYGGARRSTTVAFPLYWDIKRPRRRTTVVFPFYWRFDRPDHTSMVVVNSYYRRSKRDGTYRFHFIPLFNVQRRRPGDLKWEVLTGLFGYERIGRNRFLTLFWALNIRLDPLPHKPGAAPQRQAPPPPKAAPRKAAAAPYPLPTI